VKQHSLMLHSYGHRNVHAKIALDALFSWTSVSYDDGCQKCVVIFGNLVIETRSPKRHFYSYGSIDCESEVATLGYIAELRTPSGDWCNSNCNDVDYVILMFHSIYSTKVNVLHIHMYVYCKRVCLNVTPAGGGVRRCDSLWREEGGPVMRDVTLQKLKN
jgi:hypothetical protein